jgi:glycosyltransferase involved in cell wall biosynthesis
LHDVKAFIQLVRLYRKLRPDVVHHVTVKPVLYGTLAARVTRVPAVVNAISGRGRLFLTGGLLSRLRARTAVILYRLALRHPNTVSVFQNAEDRRSFIQSAITTETNSALIEGSGTELRRFHPEIPPDDPLIVLLPARILRQKGVGEFICAARILKREGSTARFAIVGDAAGNRAAYPRRELELATREGLIEMWGWSNDMPGVMARAAIVCLPTYHEGLPKALIDACAAGRPIVATDIPGCQAIVKNGVNGLLVPPRDHESLADAIRALLSDAELRDRMGSEGVKIAVLRFDISVVIERTLAIYGKIGFNSRRAMRRSHKRSTHGID